MGKETSIVAEKSEAAGNVRQADVKPTSDEVAPSESGFRWLEQADGPPTHLGLSTSLKQRTYYSGFIQVGGASSRVDGLLGNQSLPSLTYSQ